MPALSYGYAWNGALDARGRLWKPNAVTDGPRTRIMESGIQEGEYSEYWNVVDPATEEVDSVFLGEVRGRSYIHVMGNGRRVGGIPFDPGIVTRVDPLGGFWRVNTAAYRIAHLNEAGDTTLVIEADVAPEPVTAEDKDRFAEGWAERGPDLRGMAAAIVGYIGDTKPVIASLFTDDQGNLWVRRTATADGTTLYDVFDRTGDYRGTLAPELRVRTSFAPRVRNGYFYALEDNELQVPVVVRARVPDPATGN